MDPTERRVAESSRAAWAPYLTVLRDKVGIPLLLSIREDGQMVLYISVVDSLQPTTAVVGLLESGGIAAPVGLLEYGVYDPSSDLCFYNNRIVIGVGDRLLVFVGKDKWAVELTFLMGSILLGVAPPQASPPCIVEMMPFGDPTDTATEILLVTNMNLIM
ncbi:hypothetical protein ACLOJK_039024 [Asimina triloba]